MISTARLCAILRVAEIQDDDALCHVSTGTVSQHYVFDIHLAIILLARFIVMRLP